MQWIEESGEVDLELFYQISKRRKMEISISKKEKLAMRMYDDYCEAVGGKAFNGDDLPKSDEFFNDQKKQIQAMGWVKAAETAIDFCGREINYL